MKRLLLLLFIFVNLTLYANGPTITLPCGPGQTDLSANANYFIGSQNPQDVTLSYFLTMANAQANMSPIATPSNYLVQASTTIFVRIENAATSTITFDGFQVVVNAPIGVIINQPSPTVLVAQVFNGTPPFTYVWQNNAGGIQPSNGNTLVLQNGIWGGFFVTVTDMNGCSANWWISVQQSLIVAGDDTIDIALSGSDTSTSSASIFTNDSIGSGPIAPEQVQFSSTNIPSGFSLNEDGTVTVLPGTAAGSYSFTYTVCELLENTCATATATINVVSDGFLLRAFIDANGNGTRDLNENNFSLGQFRYEINDSGVNTVLSPTGTYLINETNPANIYDFSFAINNGYEAQYSLATTNYSGISYVAGSGVTVYDFAVTALPYTDLAVGVYSLLTPPRPGFDHQNTIFYTNNGTQPMSGTVSFTHDSRLSITGISPTGTVATANGFTYYFTDLQPHETRSIVVTLLVPTLPTVSIGDMLINAATITIPEGDILASNNHSFLVQPVVGSYDPNDKTESHGGKIVFEDFTSDDFLTYTIRFENTGTYAAENVKVTDVLDDQLDETSIRMVAASNDYSLIREGKNLTWHFNGIDLPPSVADTEIGQGYLTFQVKPKAGYALGDIIPNSASIYFDFNPAIVTQPCLTEFVNALATRDFTFDNLKYAPNPVKNQLTISNDSTIEKITVTSMLGQTVLEQVANNLRSEVDFSSLSAGIYIVKITTQNQQKQIKITKQ